MKNLIFLLLIATLAFSCSKQKTDGERPEAETTQPTEILSAGATFPYPLYSKMFDSYRKLNQTKVNYQAIGSGGGIRQLLSQTVDFGATDAFMNKDEMNKAEKPIIHIPTCLGAVVISYNLPGHPTLKLTSDIISGVFLGDIQNWNNKKIKALNPSVDLPDSKIVVVHRSDGSGTTFIFSDYLTKVSSKWKQKVGRGKSLNWPIGLGGKGNQGVAGLIQQTPGSIGYVELIYASSNSMPAAIIKNEKGHFITPSIKSVSEAANATLPADTRISLTNTNALDGYPLASFTWLILYNDLKMGDRTAHEARGIMDLLWWMTHEGQLLVEPLHYAPLTTEAVQKAEVLLKSIKYGGKKIL